MELRVSTHIFSDTIENMPCFNDTGFLRFVLNADMVTISAATFNFQAGDGESWLDLFGVERTFDARYLASAFLSYNGKTHRESPVFSAPAIYRGKLQLLNDATYFGLRSIARRSNYLNPIRLHDYLIPLDQDTPRSRGRVGAELPSPFAGVVRFYPQYNVTLTVTDGIPSDDGWTTTFEAVEFDPKTPVPASEVAVP